VDVRDLLDLDWDVEAGEANVRRGSTCPNCGSVWRGDGKRRFPQMFNGRVICPRCYVPSRLHTGFMTLCRKIDRRLPATEGIDR
jgi:hypothetical protein